MRFLTLPVLYGLAAALAVALLFAGIQSYRLNSERTAHAETKTELATDRQQAAEAIVQFEVEARATEQRHSADMARIEKETRERTKEAGDDAYDRAIADVRAGRLRNVWTCPAASPLPSAGRAATERDGASDDQAAAIGRVLRIGSDADEQLAACQAVIRSDRRL